MPVSLDFNKKDKKASGGTLDEEMVLEHLEKIRDFMLAEIRKARDEQFKQVLDLENKIRDKIDKKDLEEIESKIIDPDLPLEKIIMNVDL